MSNCNMCTGRATGPDLHVCRRCTNRIGPYKLTPIFADLFAKDRHGNRKSVYERTQIVVKAAAKYGK